MKKFPLINTLSMHYRPSFAFPQLLAKRLFIFSEINPEPTFISLEYQKVVPIIQNIIEYYREKTQL